MQNQRFVIYLLWAQGLYFSLTGMWPVLHISSFMWVTGPKQDIWLVKTVGSILAVIGLVYLVAAYRKEYQPAIGVLAFGSAICLFWIDVYYALTDVIWDIYLLDAAAEGVLILLWIFWIFKSKN